MVVLLINDIHSGVVVVIETQMVLVATVLHGGQAWTRSVDLLRHWVVVGQRRRELQVLLVVLDQGPGGGHSRQRCGTLEMQQPRCTTGCVVARVAVLVVVVVEWMRCSLQMHLFLIAGLRLSENRKVGAHN